MKISERVENILRASTKARNSDKELLVIYMQKSGMELNPKQIEIFKSMPSMETIRRIRQKLQEQGKYPADSVVEEARYQKFVKVKYGINHEEPEDLIERDLAKLGYKIKPFGE